MDKPTVNDEQVRAALGKAYERLGVGDGVGEAVRPSERRTTVVGETVAVVRSVPLRRIPPAVTRGFADEVGHRVMCWDWIENRRGEVGSREATDRYEAAVRDGGTFLAWHMRQKLMARRMAG